MFRVVFTSYKRRWFYDEQSSTCIQDDNLSLASWSTQICYDMHCIRFSSIIYESIYINKVVLRDVYEARGISLKEICSDTRRWKAALADSTVSRDQQVQFHPILTDYRYHGVTHEPSLDRRGSLRPEKLGEPCSIALADKDTASRGVYRGPGEGWGPADFNTSSCE